MQRSALQGAFLIFALGLAVNAPASTADGTLDVIRKEIGTAEWFAAGNSFRDCPDCPEMVVVPAGSFTMGSPEGEELRHRNEGPQRTVTFPNPFSVGKFEVTFAEWDACVAAKGCDDAGPRKEGGDNGWGRGRRPVIEVSWYDAKQYIVWLNKKLGLPEGQSYRLLTEAEWEYAARAGTTTRYAFGNEITKDQARFSDSKMVFSDGKTAEVGSFSANAWGVHDMHGNVWEWVEDCYHGSYNGAPTDGSTWTTGCEKTSDGKDVRRVLRGGSWINDPPYLRASIRVRFVPVARNSYVGFRLGRTLSTRAGAVMVAPSAP